MGFCKIISTAMCGLGVEFVQVEADVCNGLPIFHMVGYLSSEVKEAAERVRAAIRNSGIILPGRKIVVNLSPADVRKSGTSFDLPIAIAVLGAMELIPAAKLKNMIMLGELSLDGRLRPVEGILPMVLEAKRRGFTVCVLPKENQEEGRLIEGMDIKGAVSLQQVLEWIKTGEGIEKSRQLKREDSYEEQAYDMDYSDIQGQEGVKRSTLIAVAGNHNLLYIGPPGAGKTMMAKRIPTILPRLTEEESMEITGIYSVMGLLSREHPMLSRRPYREVHHTVTRAALTGGGRLPMPGECTLAHRGVLFLDELAEFSGTVLESLRQPLEEKRVRLSRQRGSFEFPADFMLAAAMNPCPCGYYPDLNKCVCTDYQVNSYLGKISQPFLDRIDICSEVPPIAYEALSGPVLKGTSINMRKLVEKARNRQIERFAGENMKGITNAWMGKEQIEKYCALTQTGKRMMGQAFEVMQLTARSYYKILKVARTIADLDDATHIKEEHLAEAIACRPMDKTYWKK